MNTDPTVELEVGQRVRVTSRHRGPNWVRKGNVEKISIPALVAFVRWSDGTGSWVEFERITVLPPSGITVYDVPVNPDDPNCSTHRGRPV